MTGKSDAVMKAVQQLGRSDLEQDHEERARQLLKAVQRLERLDKYVQDHEERAWQIRGEFKSLNAYLDENPGSKYREYIEKCKQSHICSHLKRLSVLEEPDRETWFVNIILLEFISDREVAKVLEQQPEKLKSWYKSFVKLYQLDRPITEFRRILKRRRLKHWPC